MLLLLGLIVVGIASALAVRLIISRRADLRSFDAARREANSGNARAQYELGLYYSTGKFVPKDYSQALLWYDKAAEQGDAMGENGLGFLYSNALGVPQNYTTAILWYHKAAEQGNSKALFNLGNMYLYGRGVAQDNAEAYRWFRMAAAGGNEEAERIIGIRWLGAGGGSKLTLSTVTVITLLYLAAVRARHARLWSQRYYALTLTSGLSLIYIVALISLPSFSFERSLLLDHCLYVAGSFLIGTYVVLVLLMLASSEKKPATAKIVFGIAALMLVAFNVFVGIRVARLRIPPVLRGVCYIDGLLLAGIVAPASAMSRDGEEYELRIERQ